jgi:hypothetical protein
VLVAVAVAGVQLGSTAAANTASPKRPKPVSAVKLPERLKTPTGNFITLYAFESNGSVESADVSICTSAHTPPGTEAIPFFFSLGLSNGSSVRLTGVSSKTPALRTTPLGPKQCVRGWISFTVPQGAHASALVYSYGTPIKWKLG